MRLGNKGNKLLAMLLAVMLFVSLFPLAVAEDGAAEAPAEQVTSASEEPKEEVKE